ncbi:hypothetical protein D3C86_2003790 [compost metagenome]
MDLIKPETDITGFSRIGITEHDVQVVAPPHGIVNQAPVPYRIIGGFGHLVKPVFTGRQLPGPFIYLSFQFGIQLL